MSMPHTTCWFQITFLLGETADSKAGQAKYKTILKHLVPENTEVLKTDEDMSKGHRSLLEADGPIWDKVSIKTNNGSNR